MHILLAYLIIFNPAPLLTIYFILLKQGPTSEIPCLRGTGAFPDEALDVVGHDAVVVEHGVDVDPLQAVERSPGGVLVLRALSPASVPGEQHAQHQRQKHHSHM